MGSPIVNYLVFHRRLNVWEKHVLKKLLSFRHVSKYRRAIEKYICPDRVFPAFIDFEYHHYALGDLLTKEVEIACRCIEAGCSAIDLYISVDPHRPAAPTQGFINQDNYKFHLDNLAGAMFCQPLLRSIHFLRDSGLTMNLIRKAANRRKIAMWPSYKSQLNRQVHYPFGHSAINRHFVKYGSIPNLTTPKGFDLWADRFLSKYFPENFTVVVNPRQSRLTPVALSTYRDADLSVWNSFFKRVGQEFPSIQFIYVGGYDEIEMETLKLPNVLATRSVGLELAHELALIVRADMFIGSSSGFATMATFCNVPYLICDVEQYFSKYVEIGVGENYPFSHEGQVLLWEKEDADILFAYLERELERVNMSTHHRKAV